MERLPAGILDDTNEYDGGWETVKDKKKEASQKRAKKRAEAKKLQIENKRQFDLQQERMANQKYNRGVLGIEAASDSSGNAVDPLEGRNRVDAPIPEKKKKRKKRAPKKKVLYATEDELVNVFNGIVAEHLGMCSLSDISNFFSQTSNSSWKKQYRKRFGPLLQFLQKHQETFSVRKSETGWNIWSITEWKRHQVKHEKAKQKRNKQKFKKEPAKAAQMGIRADGTVKSAKKGSEGGRSSSCCCTCSFLIATTAAVMAGIVLQQPGPDMATKWEAALVHLQPFIGQIVDQIRAYTS